MFCFAVSPSGLFKAFQSRLPRPKRVLLPSLEPKLESEFSGAQNTQDFCHPNLTCDRGMDLMFTPIANWRFNGSGAPVLWISPGVKRDGEETSGSQAINARTLKSTFPFLQELANAFWQISQPATPWSWILWQKSPHSSRNNPQNPTNKNQKIILDLV